MEIKDITVSVERLEDVRGGQRIDVSNFALQIGANHAASNASSFGVGNQTSSVVAQDASQSLGQYADVSAVEDHRRVLEISNSVVGGFFGPRMLV